MNEAQNLRLDARTALQAGRAVDAETAARALLRLAPDADGWDILACALGAQHRLEESIAASDEALRLNPSSANARHSRGVTLNLAGRAEAALLDFDALVARGARASALSHNRATALSGAGRDNEAEAVLADAVKQWPTEVGLHNALAKARWGLGEGSAFTRDYERVLEEHPDALPLRLGCADLLRRAGFADKAEALLREGLARRPDQPALLGLLGMMLTELDRGVEGLAVLQRAIAVAPDVAGLRPALTATLLRLGRGDEALLEIECARRAQPLNQEWIGFQSMAYRQLSDPRYHELCDYDLMVRAYDLTPPPGFANFAAFNEALAASLRALHTSVAHPLDQSLRNGSQTTRNLMTVNDPVIRAYIAALNEPIRAYMDLMRDPDHPWSGRKTGDYKFAGAWSVKLKADGFHVNHLHPDGWISSAYYVALPAAVTSGADQQGWIKFGEPRWPTPGCGIEKVIQPQVGRLVLFPSYMWHGTIPFSEGERLTAPFDVVPA